MLKGNVRLDSKTDSSIFKYVCSPRLGTFTKLLRNLFPAAFYETQRNMEEQLFSPIISAHGKNIIRLFVLSDHQTPKADETYFGSTEDNMRIIEINENLTIEVYRYNGFCGLRYKWCHVVDFEIASRANVFIGSYPSSASRNIAQLRDFRPLTLGPIYPSILFYFEGLNYSLADYFQPMLLKAKS
eukprot:snap_masked-scaffold_7-processed-gene-9.35-mRNA-1 protein AED:1.00 eAED:1.00 QI:0/-1/0/0/-1/1/1/0/184